MLPSERLHPHTPSIVKVGSDRADRALLRPRNGHTPHRLWQVLDELDGDAVVRPPNVQEVLLQIEWWSQSESKAVFSQSFP